MPANIQDVKDLSLKGLFNDLTDAQINNALKYAQCFIEESSWWKCADEAHALLAAHYLMEELMGLEGKAGQVTSESAGGLSRSYGQGGNKDPQSAFSTTTYGRRFLELRSVQPFTPLVIT